MHTTYPHAQATIFFSVITPEKVKKALVRGYTYMHAAFPSPIPGSLNILLIFNLSLFLRGSPAMPQKQQLIFVNGSVVSFCHFIFMC